MVSIEFASGDYDMIINSAVSDHVSRKKYDSASARDELGAEKADFSPDSLALKPSLSFSSSESRKLFNDKIIAALEKTLTQRNQVSLYELNPDDFSPEKVANRILSFVGVAVSAESNVDKETLSIRLQQARAGIAKGFNEAKDILDGLQAFSGKVKENADETYRLLETGLDNFAEKITLGLPLIEMIAKPTSEFAVVQEASFKQSFDLQLKTLDGDTVKVRIANLQTSQVSGNLQQSVARIEAEYESRILIGSGYIMSIKGNLDDDELQAIDDLLSEMTAVANQYFSGDVQTAIKRAEAMGYNASEIANFSLELNEAQQAKVTTVYQAVSSYHNERASMEKLDQIKLPLRDFATNLSQTYRDFLASGFFKDNESRFRDILADVMELNHFSKNTDGKNEFNQIVSNFLAKL